MSVLVYSPEIQLIVACDSGMYDVSNDIVSGSCTLQENASHQMSCVLMNKGRRYDKLFKPDDRFALYMKRLSKLLIMTGYLDSVPIFSAWPRSIQISGSSTLKRLQYHFWDPGTAASVALFNDTGTTTPLNAGDQLITQKAQDLLTKVAGWNPSQIHFGSLPSQWFTKISSLAQTVFPQIGINYATGMPVFSGETPFTSNLTTTSFFVSTSSPIGTALPADFGTVAAYQGPQDIQPLSSYYCQMQWGYQNLDGSTPANISPATVKQFLKGQKLMVGSPDSGQAVIVEVAGWGPPAASGAAIGLSSDALGFLGLNGASPQVQIAWITAPDNIAVGPYNAQTQTTAGTGATIGQIPATLLKLERETGISVAPTNTAPLQYNNTSYTNSTASGQSESPEAQAAVAFALKQVGAPYVWGGLGPYSVGYDCSGLFAAAWAQSNVEIVRPTTTMWQNLDPLTSDPSTWLPGDAVFYNDGTNNGIGGAQPGHVKMFVGQFAGGYLTVEAGSSATGVFVSALDLGADFMGARRVTAKTTTQVQGGGAGPGSIANSLSGGNDTGSSFLSTWAWIQDAQTIADPLSNALTGYRSLMNDVPLLPTIQQVVNASMRSFCSAPNGDFIAWFPDYFNIYNTLGVIQIQDIELQDFTIQWSDLSMVTHQFAAGTYSPISSGTSSIGGLISTANEITTGGVATIDFPALLENLLSLNPNDPTFSSTGIYNRFGARPNYQELGVIMGPMAEFWYAVYLFQMNWASQFGANVPLVFMPELYPGMIMQIASKNFQVYVSSVTHTWNLAEGGGFTTSAVVTAPSVTGGGGFYGLVKGGNWGS